MLWSRRLRTLLSNLPRLRKNGCRGFLVLCTSLLENSLLPLIYQVPSTHCLTSLTRSLDFWGFGQRKMNPLVETKYGLVPQGSVLSYQRQQTSKRSSENLAYPVLNFDLPDLGFPPTVLTKKELLHFNSLAVSLDQALEYERITRDQSMSPDWHRLFDRVKF